MRYLRMLGLCMVAACAIAVVTSASASAMGGPEWGRCEKVPVTIKGKEHKKGKFGNANCTEAGSEFEFVKGTEELPGGAAFTAKQTSEKAELETGLGISVTCANTTATGNVSGTNGVSGVQVTFTGCELEALNFACEGNFTSSEEPNLKFEFFEGEIITRTLKGKLGYISGKGTAEPKVGLALEPEEKGGLLAEFVCGVRDSREGGPLIVRVGAKEKHGSGDSIISPVTPINTMAATLTQTYEAKLNEAGEREKGIQEPQGFENGKKDTLESESSDAFGTFGWTPSSQIETINTSLNSGEELEIKA